MQNMQHLSLLILVHHVFLWLKMLYKIIFLYMTHLKFGICANAILLKWSTSHFLWLKGFEPLLVMQSLKLSEHINKEREAAKQVNQPWHLEKCLSTCLINLFLGFFGGVYLKKRYFSCVCAHTFAQVWMCACLSCLPMNQVDCYIIMQELTWILFCSENFGKKTDKEVQQTRTLAFAPKSCSFLNRLLHSSQVHHRLLESSKSCFEKRWRQKPD